MKRKNIGIIGGMGPEATVDLMNKIIKATPAKIDQEHLRMFVDNNPQIPSRIEAILEGAENPGPTMAESAKKLEEAGADFLIIPCNTAHYFVDAVKEAVDLPLVSIIEETVASIKESKLEEVAILATTATLKTKLYEEKLEEEGIRVILPEEKYQKIVMEIINHVKAGEIEAAYGLNEEVIEHIKAKGARAAILGCTELPLGIDHENLDFDFFDPTNILARAAVREALGK